MNLVILGDSGTVDWHEAYIESARSHGFSAGFLNLDLVTLSIDQSGIDLGTLTALLDSATHGIFLPERYEPIYYYIALLYPNIKFVNGESVLKYPNFSNKFLQAVLLKKYDLPLINSKFIPNPSLDKLEKLNYPLVAKNLDTESSYGGLGVEKIADSKSLMEFLKGKFLGVKLEEFVAKGFDFRTIVVGGKIIGTVKRVPNSGFKSNGSDKQENFEQDPNVLTVLLDISQRLELEMVAFDYVVGNGIPLVYEMNRFPYFTKFQHATGISVADAVIEYLLQK